jgi:hypothetical protein
MRRIMTGLTIVALATVLAATAAQAGPITRREARQRARIQQGVRSGELTPGETKKLRNEQGHVEQMREHAVADGKIGPRERVALRRAQNKASRDIYRLKHNAREMPGAQ